MFLIELLETYPHYLGDQEEIGDLPFMFKVLSINKALSIQVRFFRSLEMSILYCLHQQCTTVDTRAHSVRARPVSESLMFSKFSWRFFFDLCPPHHNTNHLLMLGRK